jgi:integral membrane protein
MMSNPTTYRASLLRYRIMAFTTGTVLLVGCFVALPLRYAAGEHGVSAVVWTSHGFLFIVYLIATADLGLRMRWGLVRLLLTMAAGTIPFLSFVAERNVRHLAQARMAAAQSAATA